MTGRADFFRLGDWNALCYECGRKRKASTMKKHWQGYWVCPEHWESRQPQDFVRGIPDIITPPWTQPPPEDFYVPPVIIPAGLRITPDIWPNLGLLNARRDASRMVANQSSLRLGSPLVTGLAVEACWLAQCIDVISTTDVIAEVGYNGVSYSGGFASDSSPQFLSANTVNGSWKTPDTPDANRVGVAVASTNWRVEAWVYWSATNNVGNFIEITPVGPGVGTFHIYFGWGLSSLNSVLTADWSTTYSSGGGTVNGTAGSRASAGAWHHIMLQNNASAKNFMFLVDGKSLYGHGGGGTQVWSAGTSLEVAFREVTASVDTNWGGACVRCGLPDSAMYAYPGQDIQVFTPPTARLPRFYAPF